MTNRILSQNRLEKLIKRLEAWPIFEWTRKEENHHYEPPDNDTIDGRSRSRVTSYLTKNNVLGFIIERKDCEANLRGFTTYLLRVCEKENNEDLFLSGETIYGSEKEPKGKVQTFYEKLADEFKKYEEGLEKEKEDKIQRKLDAFLESRSN